MKTKGLEEYLKWFSSRPINLLASYWSAPFLLALAPIRERLPPAAGGGRLGGTAAATVGDGGSSAGDDDPIVAESRASVSRTETRQRVDGGPATTAAGDEPGAASAGATDRFFGD
jgi:hypothetical protein